MNSLRHVLKMCGWLKKVKNRYGLTAKGLTLLEKGFSAPHFFTLLKVFVRRFDWSFQDGFPPLWIIQGGALFSLYLLRQTAGRFVPAKEMGDAFIRAFPAVLDEVRPMPFRAPGKLVSDCFSLRFLERFCEYFGFAEIRREEKGPYRYDLFVRTSEFYDRYLTWAHVG